MSERTKWVQVATELLAELGEWSEPVPVKVDPRPTACWTWCFGWTPPSLRVGPRWRSGILPCVTADPPFDRFAEAYESQAADGAYNALYDRPAVLELLGDVSGQRVLDAGCGPGLYAEVLLARGADVVGFDQAPEMVRLARRRIGDQFDVRVHDLTSPLDWLDDGTFDAALLALVLHHVDDRVGALRELHRVLRPDGRLVVSTHHPTTDWVRLGGNYFTIEPIEEDWHGGEWHVRYWREPLEATCAAFADAGFVIERLVEPRPVAEMAERFPEDYGKLLREPGFIAFRLRPAPQT